MIKKLLFLTLLFCQSSLWATSRIDQLMADMTDEQKAAQLILVYFTNSEFIYKNEFGGVLIMQNMLKDPDELKEDLARMQKWSKYGVLVSIDQEGGRVNRMKLLPDWKKVPSAKEMSTWPDDKITAHALNIAEVLHNIGINLNLAPVLDPGRDYLGEKTFMAKKQRSFGSSAEQVFNSANSYMIGFRIGEIASVSKHFPGYDVQTNSDHEIAISQAPFENVQKNMEPFKMLASKVTGVMISSVHYEKFSDAPAVMSKKIVGMAREIHPGAILMTDDLWGKALRSWVKDQGNISNDEQVLALTRSALDAGNDMLMITYPEKAVLMKKAIVRWMKEDESFRKRVEDSVYRILKIKQEMGLIWSIPHYSNHLPKKTKIIQKSLDEQGSLA